MVNREQEPPRSFWLFETPRGGWWTTPSMGGAQQSLGSCYWDGLPAGFHLNATYPTNRYSRTFQKHFGGVIWWGLNEEGGVCSWGRLHIKALSSEWDGTLRKPFQRGQRALHLQTAALFFCLSAAVMSERRIPFTMLRTPSWDPFRDWHQNSRIFDQSFGMPALPEDFTFPCTHWPGYMRPSVLAPEFGSMMPHMMYPGPNQMMAQQARALTRQMSSGVSELNQTQDNWKVSLDVNHFSPEELVVKTKDGVVEISGELSFSPH